MVHIKHRGWVWVKPSACASDHSSHDSAWIALLAAEPPAVWRAWKPHQHPRGQLMGSKTSTGRNLFAFHSHLSLVLPVLLKIKAQSLPRCERESLSNKKSEVLSTYWHDTLYVLVPETMIFYWFTKGSELKTVMVQICFSLVLKILISSLETLNEILFMRFCSKNIVLVQ